MSNKIMIIAFTLLFCAAMIFAAGKKEAPSSGAADAEGNVAFYANITAI